MVDVLDAIFVLFITLLVYTIHIVLISQTTSWYVALSWWMLGIVSLYLGTPSRTYPSADDVTAGGIDLTNKICIVTGGTSGIGIDTVRVLVYRGATVYIAARNGNKLKQTKQQIEDELLLKTTTAASKYNVSNIGKIYTLVCDLDDLNSIKTAAEQFITETHNTLHILINNAGIMALPTRENTKQGLEKQMGICHVGHFYLTQLLLPALQNGSIQSGGKISRVVNLSSSGHSAQQITSLLNNSNSNATSSSSSSSNSTNRLETIPYDAFTAYGNAKACNILHAKAIHDRYYVNIEKEQQTTSTKQQPQQQLGKVTAFSVHPGGIHTGLQKHVGIYLMLKWYIVTPFFFKSTSQGAATTLVCATIADPTNDGGYYFEDCKPNTIKTYQLLDNVGYNIPDKLWTITDKLIAELGFDTTITTTNNNKTTTTTTSTKHD